MKRVLRYFGGGASAPDAASDTVTDTPDSSSEPAVAIQTGTWSRFDPLEPRFVALLARLDTLNQRA